MNGEATSTSSLPTRLQRFQGFALLSGLLNLGELSSAFCDFQESDRPRSTDAELLDEFCAYLIGRNILTDWQCAKLRNGQYKGFFLDGYKILAPDSYGPKGNVYLAEEAATRTRVKLVITPPHQGQRGITYRVDRD